jgi:hypothetical protein
MDIEGLFEFLTSLPESVSPILTDIYLSGLQCW